MIHSDRPRVPPVLENCYGLRYAILKIGDGRTMCVKIVITTGRDCESASWINYVGFLYVK